MHGGITILFPFLFPGGVCCCGGLPGALPRQLDGGQDLGQGWRRMAAAARRWMYGRTDGGTGQRMPGGIAAADGGNGPALDVWPDGWRDRAADAGQDRGQGWRQRPGADVWPDGWRDRAADAGQDRGQGIRKALDDRGGCPALFLFGLI